VPRTRGGDCTRPIAFAGRAERCAIVDEE